MILKRHNSADRWAIRTFSCVELFLKTFKGHFDLFPDIIKQLKPKNHQN
jgi:hypothetical protein